MCVKLILKITILSLLSFFVPNIKGNCISINNEQSNNFFNVSYHEKCYKHTIQQENCCKYFLLNENCQDIYMQCVNYEDYVLNNTVSRCHSYNKTINNIDYSDKCHHFTLQLQPYCCDNLNNIECLDWYTQCNSHDKNKSNNCFIPSKYTNEFCSEYTKHIDENCCNDFTDICSQIYQWCLLNHPNETSILDLFIGPRNGFTIGVNLKIFHNIDTVENCAQLCLDTKKCRSFDYVINQKNCYLSKHVIGDVINSGDTVELIDRNNIEAYYYELIFKMPIENTLCNVKFPSWLGDGICERRGGYNTEQCGWDGGDCCRATCNLFFCGITGFDCKDPDILYPPTKVPTKSPTTDSPTTNPTNYPTDSPTPTPTNHPSEEPTKSPTDTPTTTPTQLPTLLPTKNPTDTPTFEPTDTPSNSPSFHPTRFPTIQPTNKPTNSPTNDPTESPSLSPTTNIPTLSPTDTPTKNPTVKPTIKIIIEKSTSDDSDLRNQIISMIIVISTLSFLIVIIIFLYCKYRSLNSNTFYPPSSTGVNSQSFRNPIYDSRSKNTKQSSNYSDEYDEFDEDNKDNDKDGNKQSNISSRTRSKTKRAYQSQSSLSNEEDTSEIYDDVVYQEDSGLGYIDENEEQFMSVTNADGSVIVYEDDVNDTYIESNLIRVPSNKRLKKKRRPKSNSNLEFSQA